MKVFFRGIFRISPYIVLLAGSAWIAWTLFNPPLYVTFHGKKLPYISVPQKLLNKIEQYQEQGYSPDEIVAGFAQSKNYSDIAAKARQSDSFSALARMQLYPTPDFYTAILHSMGIAVIAGMIFYLLKRGESNRVSRDWASRAEKR
ncbi:MAG: hypothetical protein M0033_05470 [Nitrospiraceae bacterium]|nr:hypothetical protein [Nitrospiraceae bacterium]